MNAAVRENRQIARAMNESSEKAIAGETRLQPKFQGWKVAQPALSKTRTQSQSQTQIRRPPGVQRQQPLRPQ